MGPLRKPLLVAAGMAALYAVLILLRSTEIISPYWQLIMDLSLIVVIAASGLSLIYGFNGQFSLGHAAFYGVGAYTAGVLTKLMGGNQFTFALALLAGMMMAGLVAFIVGLPILRLRSDYLGIATLGLGIIVKVLLDNSDKLLETMGGSRGMLGVPQLSTFTWVFWVAVGAVLLTRNLILSTFGRAIISVREDEIAADAMGIDTTRYKTLAFVAGCMLAGLAGGLYAHRYPFLRPADFSWLKSVDYLLVVVLGGLGSLTGTVVTAIGWVFLLEWLRAVLPEAFIDWRGVIYALILIITMVLRPQGLLGGQELTLLRDDAARSKGGRGNASV